MKNNYSEAFRISILSIVVNLLLSGLKFTAGLWGHSQALLADAIHSASDVLTTFIVIISIRIASKEADQNHEYGHQKYESLGAFLLALLLAYLGLQMGWNALHSIHTKAYTIAHIPSLSAAIVALLSIVVKEGMFHCTMHIAKKERSNALKADAWHHRSDALSSIGSLAGVLFSMFGFPIMDPLASLFICIMILLTAKEIAQEAVLTLTDSACSPEIENAIRTECLSVPKVLSVDLLRTRRFGSGYYVDVEITVDKNLPLHQAHDIAEAVHDHIEKVFPDAHHCMVHVNPN